MRSALPALALLLLLTACTLTPAPASPPQESVPVEPADTTAPPPDSAVAAPATALVVTQVCEPPLHEATDGRAEILWEKGTDRLRFHRGEISKYTWVDLGSSYLPSEITAAFLWPQLEAADAITRGRRDLWDHYHAACAELPGVSRPHVPADCAHNANLYFVLLDRTLDRTDILRSLNESGVNAVYHYVTHHASPAGLRYGRTGSAMTNTHDCSAPQCPWRSRPRTLRLHPARLRMPSRAASVS